MLCCSSAFNNHRDFLSLFLLGSCCWWWFLWVFFLAAKGRLKVRFLEFLIAFQWFSFRSVSLRPVHFSLCLLTLRVVAVGPQNLVYKYMSTHTCSLVFDSHIHSYLFCSAWLICHPPLSVFKCLTHPCELETDLCCLFHTKISVHMHVCFFRRKYKENIIFC